MNPRRLYRSRHDRRLAGVAGGMAEYLEMDPTVVRVLWILGAFLGGFAILLYVIMAFVMPLEPEDETFGASGGNGRGSEPASDQASDQASGPEAGRPGTEGFAPAARRRPTERRSGRAGLFLGALLVVFGSVAMAAAVVPGWVGGAHLGPALLLAFGIVLVAGSVRRGATEP